MLQTSYNTLWVRGSYDNGTRLPMGKIEPTNLTNQLQEDYLAYSMAVLVGRAIPDLYDGLKPAQRRILQTMIEEGLLPGKPYVKCARTTGLTSAYYHPHGSAYGALINMATPWTNNVPWIDCHGNIGSSVDGPAAERYVENRLRQSAVDILLQDRETWETRPNYDGSRQEAVRFNTSLPSVLLNGDTGIAVGFATKLAPHSLQSVVEAIKYVCKGGSTAKTKSENLKKAKECLIPDFPTGPDIVKDEQLEQYMNTGGGNIRCIARVEEATVKKSKARESIVLTFTNLPHGTNPEKIGEQIKSELEKGRIVGVTAINDLSDIDGDRLEVIAKSSVNTQDLKNQLFSYTDLESKYSAKTLVIDGITPVELSPVEIIQRWVPWRLDRLKVRFQRELEIKEKRSHILEGLIKAIDKLDLIIKKIRASKDKAEAKDFLMKTPFKFTEAQAEAILEMRLRQLTNLDQEELQGEWDTINERVGELNTLVSDSQEGVKSRESFMISEISTILKKYSSTRKSRLIDQDSLSFAKVITESNKLKPAASKPRFVKVDSAKGVVQQVKGPRGAIVLDTKEKLILMTSDGVLKRVPATFKGAISTGYSAVSLAKREAEVSSKKFLAVFELEGQIKAMVIQGVDLCKSTSKGKRWLPDGAKLLHFGEGTYTIQWVSKRKKPTVLDLTAKSGKPGGKGVKVANVSETLIS